MRTRFDGDVGGNEDIRLGVVLFLPAKKHLQVFDAGKHDDDKGTNRADDEHAFENPHQHGDNQQTHKLTMVFETGLVDQLLILAGVRER